MEISDVGWNNHQWRESKPRHLHVELGKPVSHWRCIRCGRDFVTDLKSGIRYAVFASAISFHRLDEEVTGRWLKELCHGERLPGDDWDRNRKIAELSVSETAEPMLRAG